MSSIRDQIIAAAVTALNTGTPAGVPVADRLRMEPYPMADLPAMVVMPMREEIEPLRDGRWGPLVHRVLTLRVVCYAAGNPADRLLDPMLVWAAQALDSNTFGGLANDTLEGLIEWQYDSDDQQYAMAMIDFRIMYQTLRGNSTATQ